MKFSLSQLAWNSPADDDRVLLLLSKLGYQGVEVVSGFFNKNTSQNSIDFLAAKDKAHHWLEKYQLIIPSIQSIWFGQTANIFTSDEDRFKLQQATRNIIDFARAIDCHNLVFGCPTQRAYKDDQYSAFETEKVFISFLQQILPDLSKANINLNLEPNPVVYKTNFLNSVGETVSLIKKIDHPNIGLNFDLAAVIDAGENINEFDFLALKPYLNHVHLSALYLKPLDIPNTDIEILMKKLKNIDYQNFISLEMKPTNNIGELENILAYVKNFADFT